MKNKTKDDGVTSVISEMLIIALVLILTSIFAVSTFNLLPGERDTVTTVAMNSSTDNISFWHKGGDWIDAAELTASITPAEGGEKITLPKKSITDCRGNETSVFDLGGCYTVSISGVAHGSYSLRLVTGQFGDLRKRQAGDLMNRKKDDAVSAVIAMLLILAILSTCLAVYTTTYVPGLKQQSEITHSEDVKLAFERFSSDVDNIYSLKKNASFTEAFSLGGGDVVLSPMKSGGTLEISEEVIGTLVIGENKTNVTSAKLTFTPVYTSWEKQGYEYSKGLVWIVKGNKTTPSGMSLFSIDDGTKYSQSFTDSVEESIINSFTYENGNASIFLPIMSAELKNNNVTGSGVVKLLITSELTDEVIIIPSGSSISYIDAKGNPDVIRSFGSKTNLTLTKQNILAGVQ